MTSAGHRIGGGAEPVISWESLKHRDVLQLYNLLHHICRFALVSLAWTKHPGDIKLQRDTVAAASPVAASPICNANVKSPHVVPVSFTPPHPSRPLCSISSSDQPADSKTQRHKGGDKDFLNAGTGLGQTGVINPADK